MSCRTISITTLISSVCGVLSAVAFLDATHVVSLVVSFICDSRQTHTCWGSLFSSRRLGKNWSNKGFIASIDAYIIPTLASTADQTTAATPEPNRLISHDSMRVFVISSLREKSWWIAAMWAKNTNDTDAVVHVRERYSFKNNNERLQPSCSKSCNQPYFWPCGEAKLPYYGHWR